MKVTPEYKETVLKLDHVSFSYGKKQVLRDMCAEIQNIVIPGRITGQVVALLGPSGRGKTTAFETIAGLMHPTSGQVLIPEASGIGFRPVRPGEVGVVAQSYPLFAHRKVLGNLLLAMEGNNISEQANTEMVMFQLKRFGLEDLADHYPAELSGGQRQRVAILQMILRGQPLILMDEPFASLDMINIEIACAAISTAANASDLNTIIVVTHDVTAAVAIADHIWLLGFERDGNGASIPGARIVENYDLVARDLCYEPGIITSDAAIAMVKEIKERFRTL